jgi:MFS family permease
VSDSDLIGAQREGSNHVIGVGQQPTSSGTDYVSMQNNEIVSTSQRDKRKKSKKKKKKKKKTHKAGPAAVSGALTSMDMDYSFAGANYMSKRRRVPILLLWVFIMGALGSADLSIILPSLYAYVDELGGSYVEYGLILAGYNLGQVVSTPLFALWADRRSMKEVLLVSAFLGLVGNAVYLGSNTHIHLLAVGRVIAGFGAANVLLAFSHLTKISARGPERESRITYYAWITRAVQIIAPAIGAIGKHVGERNVSKVTINQFTFPALVMVVLYSIASIGLIIYVAMNYNSPEDTDVLGDQDDVLRSVDVFNVHAVMLLCLLFICVVINWMFVTAVFPFSQEHFDWSLTESYLYFVYLGCVLCLFFVALKILAERMHRVYLMYAMLFMQLLGSLMLYKGSAYYQWQLFAAGALIAGGFCFASVLLPAEFAQMIGVKSDRLHFKMSWCMFHLFCFTHVTYYPPLVS